MAPDDAGLARYYAERAREYERTPICHVDADGNQYQKRRLSDGSEHVVLKNFPTEDTLPAMLAEDATAVEYTQYDYYWLLTYTVAKH